MFKGDVQKVAQITGILVLPGQLLDDVSVLLNRRGDDMGQFATTKLFRVMHRVSRLLSAI